MSNLLASADSVFLYRRLARSEFLYPCPQRLRILQEFLGFRHGAVACSRSVMCCYEVATFAEIVSPRFAVLFGEGTDANKVSATDVVPVPHDDVSERDLLKCPLPCCPQVVVEMAGLALVCFLVLVYPNRHQGARLLF